MIPIRLELEAFLAFRKKMVLDFSVIREEKMFLITGNTGSGKTSLFDAICFALYGEASGSQRSTDSLKCQFADDSAECYVAFTFENHGKTYEIRRAPAQMKLRRGGNLSLQPASAQLTLPDQTVITKIGEVNRQIESILGLNAEQFKKIVMLPQGEFRRFLNDSSNGKQDILRRIFGTGCFEQLTEQLRQQYHQLTQQLENSLVEQRSFASQLEPLGEEELIRLLQADELDIAEILNRAERSTETAQQKASLQRQQIEQLQQQKSKLDPNAARALNQRIDTLRQAQMTVRNLQLRQPEIQQKKKQLRQLYLCREISAVEQQLERLKRQSDALSSQQTENQQQLEHSRQLLSKAQQQYEQQQAQQSQLPQWVSSLSSLQSSLKQFASLEQLTAQKEELSRRIQRLEQYRRRTELRRQLEEQQQLRKNVRQAVEAARQTQHCSNEAKSAFERWQHAYENFFRHQAAFLARQLKEGLPCPVCGSTKHPSPALDELGGAVSKEELDTLSSFYEQSRRNLERQQSLLTEKASPFTDCKVPVSQLLDSLTALEQQADSQIQEIKQQIQQIHLTPNAKVDRMTPEDFDSHYQRLEQAVQQNQLLLDPLQKQLEGISPQQISLEAQQLSERIEQLHQAMDRCFKELEQQRTQYERLAESQRQIQRQLHQLTQESIAQQQQFQSLLSQSGLTQTDYHQLLPQLQNADLLDQEIRQFEQQLSAQQQILTTYGKELEGKQPVDLEALSVQLRTLEQQLAKLTQEYESLLQIVSQNQNMLRQLKSSFASSQQLSLQYQQVAKLYHAAAGHGYQRISFERYVLGVYFDEVILSANQRLNRMTDGRYFLKRRETREKGNASSGLELDIFDSNSGKFRHVNTLSGGESFKTALSLALGLADIITQKSGGVEINTIFIDEGFGTLDRDALDSAMECLYQLKESGRYIGIISHVAELREKIPVKLTVTQGKDGSTGAFCLSI